MKRALLIIAKRPAPGQTKTRLSPPLSSQSAANLYECFLQDMLTLARAVPNTSRFIYYWPLGAETYFKTLAPDFALLPQQGDSLGARLDNVLSACLANGFQQVVIANSDSPTLPAEYLCRAFNLLNTHEAVFGPAHDGGYYLVGLTRPCPRLFREVTMSTPAVLQDTLALAREQELKTALLPPWYDVDSISELTKLQNELAQSEANIAPHTRAFLEEEKLEKLERLRD